MSTEPTIYTPTDAEIESACLSYRHDYGLMTDEQKRMLRCDALEWLRAWQKTVVIKLERKQ